MKHVTIVVPECEVNLNCIGGMHDILFEANEYWQKLGNRSGLVIQVAGFIAELKTQHHYYTIHPANIKEITKTDLVVIPAISGDYKKITNKNTGLLDWICLQYKSGAELASMCSGSFFLAATGLLEGKSCSVHCNAVAAFRQMYPQVKIVEDKVITAENGIYTNGGGYSFLNLALYLAEHLFDREVAVYCSKMFQIDIERTIQSPYSIFHAQKKHEDELIYHAQKYLEENIGEKISFVKLAAQYSISRRNFDRRFIKATGNTPVEYFQRVKVEAAKKELEKGRLSIPEIMSNVGYADDKAFRQVFRKVTGLSPLDYRNKYQAGS